MNKLLVVALVVFIVSCKKPGSSEQSPRAMLTSHKWYYHLFKQDGLVIPLSYCDTNSYLLFYEGGTGGIGNDYAGCYGQEGIISTFTYIFSPDSNIIRLKNFSGGNYTWTVMMLNNSNLQVMFTAPTPPPAYAPNFEYTYSAK